MSACNSCAFRPGSVTHDGEPYNALRGLLCALGARPFHCHHLNGADHHDDPQYLIQRLPDVRRFLQKVYVELDARATPVVLEGETLRLCEGWKEAVRQHKAKHLFDDPAIRRIRRIAADRALEVIDLFIAAPEGSLEKDELNRELGNLVYLLAAPPESEAAFALDFSGDPVPCDYPGCTAKAFHEGDHQFLSQAELNARAAAAVTSYGVGTRSYNRSGEKHEMDRQREVATARYEAAPRQNFLAPLLCSCPQRPYPHEVSVHKKLAVEKPGVYLDYYDFAIRFAEPGMRWPWSLRYAPNMEGPE